MDLPEPTKLLISAIKHSPNHLPSILRLSEIYIQKKEFHKAIRLLTDSQHNGASNSKLFYLLSKVFFLQEQWLDARINIEKSLSQDSTSVTSLELAISIYSKLEEEKEKLDEASREIETQGTLLWMSLTMIFLILLVALIVFRNARIQKKLKLQTETLLNEVQSKNKQVELAHSELSEKHKEIEDSIHYAKRIQAAILPPSKLVERPC